MTSPDISRFPVPDINDLPDDLKQIIAEVQEKAGFIPNVFLTLAHRPDELRAFWAYHEALMRKESGLSKAEREMIVVATSAVNNCLYCVVAHGAILRIYEKSTQISEGMFHETVRQVWHDAGPLGLRSYLKRELALLEDCQSRTHKKLSS